MADGLTFAQRVWATARLWLGGRKASQRRAVVLWPRWLENASPWLRYDLTELIESGYNLNALLYSAVRYRAQACASVPLRAYGGTRDKPEPLPADHQLTKLCDRPNSWMSWPELQETASTYLALFGNTYLYLVRLSRNGFPTEIIPLRPDWVSHVYRDQRLLGFRYAPQGSDSVPLLVEDVIHVKLPNPLDPFLGSGPGLSPLSALRHSLAVDNAASHLLQLLFENGAMPQGVLTFDVSLTSEQADMAIDRWVETYGGYERWGAPAVLDSGGHYERIGLTIDEMDFSAVDSRTQSQIAAVLGVPLSLLISRPELTQSTYNNRASDRIMFWQDQVVPELRRFESELIYYLRGPAGEFVSYDFSGVPPLQEARREYEEMVLRAWENELLNADEVRGMLGFAPDARGPVYHAAMAAPFGGYISAPGGDDEEESEEGAASVLESAEKQVSPALSSPPSPSVLETPTAFPPDVERKIRAARALDAIAESWERRAADAAAQALEADRRAILAIIHGEKSACYAEKRTVAWQPVLLAVLDYLRMAGRDNWRSAFAPVLTGVIGDALGRIEAEFGLRFDVRNVAAEAWFEQYELRFVDPITDTSAAAISTLLENAMANGWSIPDVERGLENLFAEWIDGGIVPQTDIDFALARWWLHRRENIARTETMRAANAGSWNVYRARGLRRKEWLATPDRRTRESHRVGAAFGKPYVVGIDEPFVIGDVHMMFPGDPNAPPEEVCNCRCTVLPVVESE